MAHNIVIGNEKGGSGKSTTTMHLATALVRMGHRVAALDLDLRQQSFRRYVENRTSFASREGLDLPSPRFIDLPVPEPEGLSQAIVLAEAEFVIVDTPGSHTDLSQAAHSMADTLVTPLNDSFVDFDLLAKVDGATNRVLGPSVYSEMVWKARQARAQAGHGPIDWIVVRNRLGSQQMHNKKKVGDALKILSKRIGFRVAAGFSERVIFRELFPRGLTLLDLKDVGVASLNLSNIAARQEVRDLVKALNLPDVAIDF